MKRLLLGILALAWAGCAHGSTIRANANGFANSLARAEPGDVIQLPEGSYTLPPIKGVAKAGPGVIVEPMPGARVVIGPLAIIDSEGLTLRGVEFRPLATGYALQVTRSKRITIRDSLFQGAVADRENARAALLKSSQTLKFINNRFRDLRFGLSGSEIKDILIEGNEFRNIYGDAIRGWPNSSHFVIRRNFFTDLYDPSVVPTHIDAIQFWTVNSLSPITDVLIEENIYLRGDGDPAQGAFLGNEKQIPYERVVIRNNAFVGTHWNGIWVVGGKDVTITNNLVQPMKWSARHGSRYEQVRPRIVVKGIEGGLVRGNAARISEDRKTSLPKIEKNTDPKMAEFGDYSAQRAWTKTLK